MRLAASLILLLLSPFAHAIGTLAGEPSATLQKAVDLLDPATIARVECDPAPSLGDADLSQRIRDAARKDIDAFALQPKMLGEKAEQSMGAIADRDAPDRGVLRRAYYANACERLNEKHLPEIEIKAALYRIAETFQASVASAPEAGINEAASSGQPHNDDSVESLQEDASLLRADQSKPAEIVQATTVGAIVPVTSLATTGLNEKCNLPARIAVPHIAESVRNRIIADANSAANDLAQLAALAQRSVDELAGTYVTNREILSSSYYHELCTLLGERGVAETEAEGALKDVASALNISHLISGADMAAPQTALTAPPPPSSSAEVEPQPQPAPTADQDGTEPAEPAGSAGTDAPRIAAAESPAPSVDSSASGEAVPAPLLSQDNFASEADSPAAADADQPSTANEVGAAEAPASGEEPPAIASSEAQPDSAPVRGEATPAPLSPAPSAANNAGDAPAAQPASEAPSAPTDSGTAAGEIGASDDATVRGEPRVRAFRADRRPQGAEDSSIQTEGEPRAEAAGLTDSEAAEETPKEQPNPVRLADAEPAAAPAEPAAAAPPESEAGAGSAAPSSQGTAGGGTLGDAECRALGVLENCPDLNAVLGQLLEKPLEYNHPTEMLYKRNSEITLVLRTDWEGKDMPTELSEEFKGLPGEVKQGISRITRVMSAELMGRDFEINPSGRQERTVILSEPVIWNWQVKPTETGPDKVLKLRLYAHLQGPGGTMPPILIKTLDANISVNVTTWDWLVISAQTLEPIYAIAAALLGLMTAILTYFLSRRRVAWEGNPGSVTVSRRSSEDTISDPGPVIGDINQSVRDSRPSQAPALKASPPPPLAAPEDKGETENADPEAKPAGEASPTAEGAAGEDTTKKE